MKKIAHQIFALLNVVAAGCFVDHSDLAPWGHELSVPVALSDLANGMDFSKSDGPQGTGRKCKGFDIYAGDELECWDFSQKAVRDNILNHCGNTSIWSASADTPGVECSNRTVGESCVLSVKYHPCDKQYDLSKYDYVVISAQYRTTKVEFEKSTLVLTAKAGTSSASSLLHLGEEQIDFIRMSSVRSLSQTLDIKISFKPGQTGQIFTLKSVIALGVKNEP